MSETLYVLTGHSRGLGAALAEALLRPGAQVLGLARRRHPALDGLAAERGAAVEQWEVDLGSAAPVASRLGAWLSAQAPERFAVATLINNAAMLAPAGPLAQTPLGVLSQVVRVGLEAPLLLTAAFLDASAGWHGRRRVLNMSSGLGRRAMAGQTSYCAVKAALDNATRALALEGVEALALAPGVIDTDMQTQLRGSNPTGFPDHASFVQLHADGRLDTPAQAAVKVLGWLDKATWATPIADVRAPLG